MSHVDETSPPRVVADATGMLEYARDGRRTLTRLDVIALACLPVLAVAAVSMPRMFSTFRGARGAWLLIPVSVVMIAGVAPLVLGVIALRRSRRRLVGIELLAWIAIAGGAVNLLATPVIVNVMTERAGWDYGVSHGVTRCASNLRMIGQACLLYANDNRGHYPLNYAQMVSLTDLPIGSLACQLSDDTPARSVAELAERGHVSYAYVGAGLTSSTATRDTVVAYERPTNHDDVGLPLHVLYGDGRVDRVNKRELERLIRELDSGHNPPRRQ
jgi:hypothetical protein